MVSAIVLADDESPQIGSPRALLKIEEKTFLQHIVDLLISARVLDIVLVLGTDAAEIQKSFDWFKGKVVLKGSQQRGELSSILAGLCVVEEKDLHGILVWPVERPLVTQVVIVEMLHKFWTQHKSIVVPSCNGRRGYPILVGKALLPELEKVSMNLDMHAFVSNYPEEIIEYQTDNEGVVISIDTPEVYEEKIVRG